MFLKIFFHNVIVMVTCRFKFYIEIALLNFFKRIEPFKEEKIQSVLPKLDGLLALSMQSSVTEAIN